MSDRINLMKKAESLDVSPEFDGYSKVVIHIDDDTYVEAGDDSGRTLEMTNPFGSQSLANQILAKVRGYQYKPYQADGALLDPAAEMGDAIATGDVYGGIYTRDKQFGRLMKTDISAPHDEEIDHEYHYESAFERKYKREMTETKAELTIHATEIAAKVSADTSENRQSFGWKLTSDSWEVFANNQTVLKATSSGLEVSGKITATSGTIGGFNIGSNAIYNNLSSFGGSQTYGVYIGTNGIQLGQNFKVDTGGTVTASSMKLKGTITFLNADGSSAGTLSAANLRKYANDAYNSACTSGGYCYGGAGGGYSWNRAKVGSELADYFKARTMQCTNFTLNGSSIAKYTAVINGVHIPYAGWGAPY